MAAGVAFRYRERSASNGMANVYRTSILQRIDRDLDTSGNVLRERRRTAGNIWEERYDAEVSVMDNSGNLQLWKARYNSFDASVSCDTATATEIIDTANFAANRVMLVNVKNSDNSIRGTAMVHRRQGTSTLDIDTLTSTGVTFTTVGGDLRVTQSSGSTVTMLVSAIVMSDA
jgi:hypothetical protein